MTRTRSEPAGSAPPSTGGDTTFELLRLAADAVADGVALLELEARVPDGPWGDARLVAGEAEIAPVPGSLHHGDGRLRATFAVPPAAAGGELAVRCDGLLVRLPEPDGDRSDRLATLAREANELRRRMFAAEQARDDAQEELARTVAERDRLRLTATDVDDERKLLRQQLQRARADVERLGGELAEARAELEQRQAPRRDGHAAHRHDGHPATVQTQPTEPPPTPLYIALAAFGVLGLLLFLTILL